MEAMQFLRVNIEEDRQETQRNSTNDLQSLLVDQGNRNQNWVDQKLKIVLLHPHAGAGREVQ